MLEGRLQGSERGNAQPGQAAVLAEGSEARSNRLSNWLNDQRVIGTLFVMPALLILAFVVVYPFLSAIWMSFQNKMVGAPATFVGFDNYVELFGDRHFVKTIKNTLVYTLFAVGLKFLLGLAMAMVLAQPTEAGFHLPHHPVRPLGGPDHRGSAFLPLDL